KGNWVEIGTKISEDSLRHRRKQNQDALGDSIRAPGGSSRSITRAIRKAVGAPSRAPEQATAHSVRRAEVRRRIRYARTQKGGLLHQSAIELHNLGWPGFRGSILKGIRRGTVVPSYRTDSPYATHSYVRNNSFLQRMANRRGA